MVSPCPARAAARLRELIGEYGDDIAGILARLYEEFQAMEEGNDASY